MGHGEHSGGGGSQDAWQGLPSPLRLGQPSEAALLASLLSQLSCFPPGGGAGAVAPLLSGASSRLVVVGPPGAPQAAAVVHLALRPGGRRVIVDEMVVDARMRGRGLGRTLLGGLVGWADGMGADVLARADPEGDALHRSLGLAPGGDAFYAREARPPPA